VAQQINVEISIKGKSITPFTSLTINQQFNGHHHFDLRFNHDVLQAKNSVIINESKDFLGEVISITLSEKDGSNYPDHLFKGIVTEVAFSNNVSSAGDLVFKGYSPTILLETGQTNASYLQKNLSQIVKDTVGSIPGNMLSMVSNPKFKSTIPYMTQYNESNFDFINRLAALYGEWFFYDGNSLNFGKPNNSNNIELKFPRDITDINLQVKVLPIEMEHHGYFAKDNKKYVSTADSQNVGGLDSFGKFALDNSSKLFKSKSTSLSHGKTESKSELDDLVKNEKANRASQLVYLKANSDSPYLKPGASTTVSASKFENKSYEDYGKYLVLNVIHSTDGLGNYQNHFEAIPAGVEIVPNNSPKTPTAEPQLAIVKNIKDPDNLGRVKVQMLWQKDNETTPFIRVMMPHSGMRADGKKNRGMFFTPELDDYVLVGFAQNDPNRPFVMGSVPHGKAINTSMNSDNDVKAIRTRSGNTIYFKDKENKKEQEILIETDENNYISILLQNGKGTTKIYSSKDIEVSSDKTVTILSEEISIKAKKNITLEAEQNITIKANKNVEISGMSVKAQAQQAFEAKGMTVKIEGSTTTDVKGSTQLNLEGGAMANLKGGMVNIN